jgi:class 3 adenylate cyclase
VVEQGPPDLVYLAGSADLDMRWERLAVHIGARVGGIAGRGEVLISHTVAGLVVGSGIKLEDRGEHQPKGMRGTWRPYQTVDQ